MASPRRLLLERLGAVWSQDSKGKVHANWIKCLRHSQKKETAFGFHIVPPKTHRSGAECLEKIPALSYLTPEFRNPELVKDGIHDNPKLNLKFHAEDPQEFVAGTLNSIRRNPQDFWKQNLRLDEKPRKSVIVEFSSPNIAKPFHMGHLRSTLVGNFVANVSSALGDTVTKVNFLGDWGTQFGVLAQGLKSYVEEINGKKVNWKEAVETHPEPLSFFYKVYVGASAESEKDPEFLKGSLENFSKLEEGEEAAIEDWRFIRALTLKELKKTYGRLGIEFDFYEGESQYPNRAILEVLKEWQEVDGGLEKDEVGRTIATLSSGRKVTLVKSDGSSIYLSRDIAAALDRFSRFELDEILYVVDNSQMEHFRAVFELLGRISPESGSKCRHINFGRILGMSTRKGKAVMLGDILDEARDRMAVQQQLSPNTRSSELQTSEALGLSCLVINDLSHKRARDYEFSWNRALASKGDSGVALQYCHARLCSLEENCGVELPVLGDGKDSTSFRSLMKSPEALGLAGELARFEDVLYESYEHLEPYLLVRYLAELKNSINKAFKVLHVKGQPDEEAQARLVLFHCSRLVLGAGLKILGVKPLRKM